MALTGSVDIDVEGSRSVLERLLQAVSFEDDFSGVAMETLLHRRTLFLLHCLDCDRRNVSRVRCFARP